MKTALVSLLSSICCFGSSVIAENADTIFLNGNIYTVNERQPKAEALAVKGDRIIFLGSNSDAQKQKGDATRVVDLRGQTVVPGLTDSHLHIPGVGERELGLNLEGATSLEDLLAKVRARAAKTERGKWVTGRGWIETFWKPPVFPNRADLDRVSPDNPVFLERADGHGAIANSTAMTRRDQSHPAPADCHHHRCGILDMCRTVVNVTGDLTIATYGARSEGYELLRPRAQSPIT